MPVYMEKAPSKMIPINRSSLYVYTKGYDFAFTEKIKLFPLRHYHADSKKWELPLSALSRVMKNFTGVVTVGHIEEAIALQYKTIEDYMSHLDSLQPAVPFDFKTKPDGHQIEFFNQMLDINRRIQGDPMGLGKTKQYLDVCEYRRQALGYRKILFICKSKHKDNMAKEVRLHTNSNYLIVDQGGEKGREILRRWYREDDKYYLIIGYEMAAAFEEELKLLAKSMGIDGVIMDEFNKIKNWGTPGRKRADGKAHLTIQITKLVEVINPELLIEGSGTPMTKDPTDLYAPLRLTGVYTRSFDEFKRYFCSTDEWGRVIGARNELELHKLLTSVMTRRPKELLRLPEKRKSIIPVRMTPEQAKLYKAAKNQIKEELKGTKVFGASQLALLTRLRQITTDPRLVDADIEGVKELYLKEWLEEVFEGGEKAVVFSIYKEETRRLQEFYRSINPAYGDGTMTSKKVQAEIDRFQQDPKTGLFIGSLHAIKESYTMTAGSYGFFMDLSWTVTDNEQAEDRLHRRGQTGIVNIIVPYCVDSIDERVLDVLAQDASAISEIVDGKEFNIRKDVVDYLLS